MIEFDAIFVGDLGLVDAERPMDCAFRQPLQIDAGGSESFGDAGFG